MSMIHLENIFKEYDQGMIKALNGVSCRVAGGEIVSLMGPSGSGKSTLLNIIGTIDKPTKGKLWLDGKDLRQYKPYDRFRASHIGFIFQLHHLMSHLTALENVEIPMFSLQRSKRQRRQKALKLLDSVNLSHKAGARPPQLSGGERQRVAVARAFANSPHIILADEPTGSLDSISGDLVLELIIDQCRTRQTTVVIATHNQKVANRADRILTLKNGKIDLLNGAANPDL